MAFNDQLYSRLVSLYNDLDDQQCHELNAKIIILLLEKITDSDTLVKIFEKLESDVLLPTKKRD